MASQSLLASRYLKSDAIFTVMSAAASRLQILIIGAIIGRHGNVGELASYYYAQATLSMFIFAGTFGLNVTAVKIVSDALKENPGHVRPAITLLLISMFTTATAAAALLIALAVPLSVVPGQEILLKAGALWVVTECFVSLFAGLFTALHQVPKYSVAGLWSALLSIAVGIFGYFSSGLFGALLWPAVARLPLIALLSIRLFTLYQLQAPGNTRPRSLMAHLGGFSVPTFLVNAAPYPALWICQRMLTASPDAAHEIASFGTATQLRSIALFIPGVIAPLVLRDLIGSRDNSGKSESGSATRAYGLLGLPVSLVVMLMSPLVANLYRLPAGGTWVLILAQVTAAIQILQSGYVTSLLADSRSQLNMLINIIWFAVFIVSAFLLRGFGASGILTGMLIAFSVVHPLFIKACEPRKVL